MKNTSSMVMDISKFTNIDFGDLTAITMEDETVWFIAKEVAKILGYKKPRNAVSKFVESDDRRTLKPKDIKSSQAPQNRAPEIKVNNYGETLINIYGLYDLVMNSKLPNAKKFRKWVTHEVLPAIQMTGHYEHGMSIQADMKAYHKLMKTIDNIRLTKDERDEVISLTKKLIESPKYRSVNEKLGEILSIADRCYSIKTIGKMLKSNGYPTGPNIIRQWMIDNKYLTKKGMPYEKDIPSLFVYGSNVEYIDGIPATVGKVGVTPKGAAIIISEYVKWFDINHGDDENLRDEDGYIVLKEQYLSDAYKGRENYEERRGD